MLDTRTILVTAAAAAIVATREAACRQPDAAPVDVRAIMGATALNILEAAAIDVARRDGLDASRRYVESWVTMLAKTLDRRYSA